MTSSFLLYHRLIIRPLRREPLRTALTVFAVALGAGVVIAIELAGGAAAGSFRSSLETLSGDADLEVSAPGGFDERLLGALATLPYPVQFRPRLDGFAVVEETGATLPLAGLDLLQQGILAAAADQNLEALRDRSSIWVGGAAPWRAGDAVSLIINDRAARYTVRGRLEDDNGPRDPFLVMDIWAAQAALGKTGRLDRIEVALPDQGDEAAWIEKVRGALPEGVIIERRGARTEANQKMLAAFRWNLRVLSYISLVVGAFLIYNTIAVSVVRRRTEIGILRALGATRLQVVAAFLAEAGFFGVLGAVAGTLMGRLMAGGAVELLAATVDALYVSSTPAPVELGPGAFALSMLIGVPVALLSALAPAVEASRVAPVEAMARGRRDHQSRTHARRDLAWAGLLGAAGALASQGPPVGGKPVFGYLAALLLIGASALAVPAAVTGASRLWRNGLRRMLGVEAMLASRSLAGSLSRTAVLVGALSTAVAMMVSVGIMVGSFRETVSLWLDNQLRADFYIRPAAGSRANQNPTMDPALPDAIERVPGVAGVDRFRLYDITYNGRPALLGAGETELILRYGRVSFLPGQDRLAILKELPRGDNVIVSEPFANKHGVRPGDVIEAPLGGRRPRFRVLGVYRDFSNERGYIIMDRRTLLRHLPDPAPSSLAVFLEQGRDLEAMRAAVEAAAAERSVTIATNRSLRAEAMRIFDRTFSITYALEAVAVAVAIMGIAGALLALVIDRRREFGLLRFLGAGGRQIWRLVLFEAGLLGLLANLIGLALGAALSLILIFVINRQSFGWTIEFHLPVAILLAGLTVVYAATVLAALYPARVAVRLNPIEVIHEE